jgi:hypothetical protein
MYLSREGGYRAMSFGGKDEKRGKVRKIKEDQKKMEEWKVKKFEKGERVHEE